MLKNTNINNVFIRENKINGNNEYNKYYSSIFNMKDEKRKIIKNKGTKK